MVEVSATKTVDLDPSRGKTISCLTFAIKGQCEASTKWAGGSLTRRP